MEAQASVNQPLPKNGPPFQKRNLKRKLPQNSADIVYTKGTSIYTLPSLSKQLKGITECVIGLQYVWEYRSPSKSVPPHYQCKLCSMSRLQHDMLDHVKGWKHGFRYMKKAHPDKVTCEEDEAVKDPVIRKAVKEAALEVQNTEGRGQIKVILKEPLEVPAFKGFRSAVPKIAPPPAPGMGPMGPPFAPRFPDSRFPGEFPPHRGPPPPPDYSAGEYREPGFGGYSSRQEFPDSSREGRPFSDGLGRRPMGGGNGFGPGDGREGFGRSGLMDESPSKMYPEPFRGNQMGGGLLDRPMDRPMDRPLDRPLDRPMDRPLDRPMDRPMNKPMTRPGLMGAAPESSGLPNTLLSYLDSFRIENESDAQLVLKVTQKLTDVLMEYRLRSVSTGSSLNSMSMSSTTFSSTPSRLSTSNDRYLGNLSGPSRYSDGPSRYYK